MSGIDTATRMRRARLAAVACTLAALSSLAAANARGGPDDPREAADLQERIAAEQQMVLELQQRLIPLLRRAEEDSEAQAEAAALEREIAAHNDQLAVLVELLTQTQAAQAHSQAAQAQDQAAQVQAQMAQAEEALARQNQERMQRALAEREAQLADRARRLEEAMHQLAELEQSRELPPLDEAEIKVFALRNARAVQAAEIVDSLLGAGVVRVAIDERTNSLIVAGNGDSLKVIEALLLRIDEQAELSPDPRAADADASVPRSLILRTFWLADALPEGQGQDPDDILPRSVLRAVEQLGLDEPRLVGQTVNSLSRDDNAGREVTFNSRVPAVVFQRFADYSCSGRVWPVHEDRIEVEVNLAVTINGGNVADLSGSLATPLGHFMVLGTANLVSPDSASIPTGMMGMEGGGFGGRGGFDGGRGGDFGAAGAVDPATGSPIGPDGNPLAPAEPKFNTSHFAFVVQVIEAESFADEQ
jgi:hypothetical protein